MLTTNIPITEDITTWINSPTSELIDHLLTNFHQRHREHLAQLEELARKVESVHSQHPACPIGLTQEVQNIRQELESHMLKEEQVLFPMLKQLRLAQAQMPIKVMMMEHEDHLAALVQINALTANLLLPADACTSWAKLYTELGIFIRELNQHIELENQILFAGKTQEFNQE